MHMSNGEVSGLSQKDLDDQGALSSQAPLISEVPTVVEAPNKKPTLKELLPPGYPQLLVHGTSSENAAKILTQGLSRGTLSTNVVDSLDSRFFREGGGRLIVTRYHEAHFQTKSRPQDYAPFRYYQIARRAPQSQMIDYDRIDTDNIGSSEQAQSTVSIPPEELEIVRVSDEQVQFFFNVLDAVMPDTYRLLRYVDGVRMLGYEAKLSEATDDQLMFDVEEDPSDRSDIDFIIFCRQRDIGKMLQLPLTAFVDFETYQRELHKLYPSEDALIEHLISIFPGKLESESGSLTPDSKEVVKMLIRQIIQFVVVSTLREMLLENSVLTSRVLYPDGEDAVGLRRLEQARQ